MILVLEAAAWIVGGGAIAFWIWWLATRKPKPKPIVKCPVCLASVRFNDEEVRTVHNSAGNVYCPRCRANLEGAILSSDYTKHYAQPLGLRMTDELRERAKAFNAELEKLRKEQAK